MSHPLLSEVDERLIDDLVAKYISDYEDIERFTNGLRADLEEPTLRSLYHSIRSRTKDPEHLRDKLRRKLAQGLDRGTPFLISVDTLYERVNDLAGVRLLHLNTDAFPRINARLKEVLAENNYEIVQEPTARVWDDEYERYFKDIGITVERSTERMYTSVHCVVQVNRTTGYTAEIQIRTLTEELWGEVDHAINYPHRTDVFACREQILVLARVASSCTRLVDSIFRTHLNAHQ